MELKTPSLDQLSNSYLLCCMTEGKSQKTIDWYSANLRRLSRFLKIQGFSQSVPDITATEVRKFILHPQNDVRRWQTSPYVSDSKGLPLLNAGLRSGDKSI